MTTPYSMQRRLRLNRPSVREHAIPPKLRTHLGLEFTAANLGNTLSMQYCLDCDTTQYPPRELCQQCLGDNIKWRAANPQGTLLSHIDLHHGLWEFFKRKTKEAPWPIASVQLDCGEVIFAHVAMHSFLKDEKPNIASTLATGTKVKVFSHADVSQKAVLIMVANDEVIETPLHRYNIANKVGLLQPASK